MKNNEYHTVGTVVKYHTVGTVLKYHTVGTVLKYHTVGTVLKYHTVGTVLKYHTVGTVLKYHTVRTVLKYHTVRTVLKYHTVRTVLKAKRKIVEIGKIGTSNIQIHDLSPLTYKYMTSHFPGFILALELTVTTNTNNSPIPTQQFSLNTCLEKGGEWNGLCTLKTFIVDSGKERAHCSRY